MNTATRIAFFLQEAKGRKEMQTKLLEKGVWLGLTLLLLGLLLTGVLGYHVSFFGLSILALIAGFSLLLLKITGLAQKWQLSNPTSFLSTTVISFLIFVGACAMAIEVAGRGQGANNSSMFLFGLLSGWLLYTNRRIDNINERINDLYRLLSRKP